MAAEKYHWDSPSLSEVRLLLADLKISWWVGGGCAIDLFVGYETRQHEDLDLCIFRADQLILQEYLSDWELHKTNQPGLKPWPAGEYLHIGVNQVWARKTSASPWELEFMFMEKEANRWFFRKEASIGGFISELFRETPDGIRYLSPEIQLLFKASPDLREKDERDFNVVLPLLSKKEKNWLQVALRKLYPESHPWVKRLANQPIGR